LDARAVQDMDVQADDIQVEMSDSHNEFSNDVKKKLSKMSRGKVKADDIRLALALAICIVCFFICWFPCCISMLLGIFLFKFTLSVCVTRCFLNRKCLSRGPTRLGRPSGPFFTSPDSCVYKNVTNGHDS
jgi:hypothetical protein